MADLAASGVTMLDRDFCEVAVARALRAAVAHILVVRDGPALQPGPRRYTRSWIRDAATMSAALLRLRSDEQLVAVGDQ